MKYLTIPLTILHLSVSIIAAPAIIWRNENGREQQLHSSEAIDASVLIEDTVASNKDKSLASIIFLMGRDADGNEALSQLASSGMLPNIASKYEAADSIYYQVNGLESRHTVARDARKGLSPQNPKKAKEFVLDASIPEVHQKLNSLSEEDEVEVAEISADGSVVSTNKKQRRRDRAVDKANVLVVHVGVKDDMSDVDAAVAAAATHPKVGSVVLSGVRSVDEVKHERMMISRRKLAEFTDVRFNGRQGRRRLDEQDDADDQNNDDEVVYYVSLTPNIFAGLLFGGLFLFVAYTGLMCMNMIEGQDVFTEKMPGIGREA